MKRIKTRRRCPQQYTAVVSQSDPYKQVDTPQKTGKSWFHILYWKNIYYYRHIYFILAANISWKLSQTNGHLPQKMAGWAATSKRIHGHPYCRANPSSPTPLPKKKKKLALCLHSSMYSAVSRSYRAEKNKRKKKWNLELGAWNTHTLPISCLCKKQNTLPHTI